MKNSSIEFSHNKNKHIVSLALWGGADAYAARFAAKEAVVKAFGTGMRGGSWQDIEVVVDDSGAPHIKLHGYFAYSATKRKIYNIFLSLSHSKEYAIAQAILEG